MEYIFHTGKVFKLGLTFEMAYDGIGIVMLSLSNLVIFLVALANYNRSEANSPLFAGLMFIMQFGKEQEESVPMEISMKFAHHQHGLEFGEAV